MMRGRVEYEIGNVGYRGTPSWDGNIKPPTRSGAENQVPSERQRVSDMLDDMKRTNRVILPAMAGRMVCNGFVADIAPIVHWKKVRIEADIGHMWQMARQPALAAANIKDFLSRSNQFGDPSEFRPGKTGSGQEPMEIAPSVKIEIEFLVPFQHRFEESEPTWRLPQPEMPDLPELLFGRNSKCGAPQTAHEPGTDRLNAALRGEAGDWTERDRFDRHYRHLTSFDRQPGSRPGPHPYSELRWCSKTTRLAVQGTFALR
jgi:hypothetical protein